MYNGIGLNTARGSGTSGYIQKNLSTVRRTKRHYEKDDPERDIQRLEASLARPPNEEILEHRRKREIEVKCLERREQLEEEGCTEEDIEKDLVSYRKELLEKAAKAADVKEHKIHLNSHGRPKYQDTHSMAAMSQSRNKRLKSALGIDTEFKEGSSYQLLDSSKDPKDSKGPKDPKDPQEEQQDEESVEKNVAPSISPPIKTKEKEKKKEERAGRVVRR